MLRGGAEQQVGDGAGTEMASRTGVAGRQAGSDMRLAEIRMAPIVMAVNAMKARTRHLPARRELGEPPGGNDVLVRRGGRDGPGCREVAAVRRAPG